MVYYGLRVVIYIISVLLTMYGLNAINFEKFLKKNHVSEFYVLYIILSVSIGYLFASFLLSFVTLSSAL